ncbi:hypothetical protein OS175_04950 [Marinicella sp. S1101]|uniref:PAN domain-containing protein n=1 Tax=Marinicella marina TaxID=2996016 RepID=UPI002260A89C|nr:PAN domain-containing protein [Marinicella marina]MCX7553215.1 hypothetical protein [Marinicella marina]MDJ1138947.1 hypothetical protein [Marinicella marina]
MKNQLKLTTLISLVAAAMHVQAMEKDTIYNMPADADFSQYYLPNEAQPSKGAVTTADQCLKACEANQACVVWTFKPGRFGSPASCKLSPKMMSDKGVKSSYAGAASGEIDNR